MHRYTIQPIDRNMSPTEQLGQDPACALHLVSRLHCKEADVFEDGTYIFSLQMDDNNLMCIFQRESLEPVVAA